MVKAFELKEELVSKHGYSDDLAQSIAREYESVCDYYRDELTKYGKSEEDINRYMDVILNEVKSCKFVISNIQSNDVRSLKLRDGLYESEPVFINDAFVGVEKKVTLPSNFSSDNMDHVQIIARSIMNLSRSALNPYTAYEDKVDVREGFMSTTYSKNGDKISSKGIGLEVGSKDYMMHKLMNEYYQDGYELPKTSHSERLIAGSFMDSLGMGGEMIEAGLTGDTTKLDSKLTEYGDTTYEAVRDHMDHIHELEIQKQNAVTDDEKYRLLNEEINEYIRASITPITMRLSDALTNSMEEENEKAI